MADIRIKDLTTTASSTASGDFFVIDGTTGTRKVNAFSPTFGGNATVTGTLTVNGTGLSQMVGNANTRLEVGNAIEDQRAHIGVVQRLNLGNPIFSKNLAGKSASDAYTTIATTPASGYSGIECGYGGVIRLLNGTGATTAGAEVTPVNVLDTTTTRVAIPLTTASTSTSSGALLVSGGVGVAGSIYAGATAKIGTATNYVWCGGLGDGAIHSYRTGADGYLRLTRGGVRDWDLFGGTNFTIAPDSGSAVLTLTSAGALTLGSSVQTSAPSGGTAAAWKLGTVATVSPTSPNRTIEVDIGGTIYYIHAKTTNN